MSRAGRNLACLAGLWLAGGVFAGALSAQAGQALRVEHFAQRGAAWDAALRPADAGGVRVCSGGVSLAFADTPAPRQDVLAGWLQAVAAVNVAACDLAFWESTAHDRLPLVSANARAKDGTRLGRAFAVLQPVGGPRLAVLGVIARPVPAPFAADDPEAALRTALPEALAQSDATLLLVDGDVAAARRLLVALPQIGAAIAAGGTRSDARLSSIDGRSIAQSPQAGTALARLELVVEDGRLRAAGHWFVTAYLDHDAQARAADLRTALTQAPPVQEPEDAPPPPVRGLAGFGIEPRQVDAAIARASAYLWTQVRVEDPKKLAARVLSGASNELLATLALVHADEPRRTPACGAWLDQLLDELHPSSAMQTYQAGVLAMIVEASGKPRHLPLLRRVARFLVESQGRGGTWGYAAPVADDLLLDPDQRVLQVVGGTPLDGSPKSLLACPRLSAPELGVDGDNSTTQFALLGLRAARHCDLEIPADVWGRARAAMLRRQQGSGGFSYSGEPTETATGSMTAAGVCSLAIAGDALGLGAPADDPAIRRGVRWLDAEFRVDANPHGAWNSYYRYSLERTGRILDSELIGRHEWYPLGVRYLLDTQQEDGRWQEPSTDPVLETSFSVLFLTRATARLHEELHRGGSGTLVTGTPPSAVGRLYLILDASGSMLEQRDGQTKFDVARAGALALVDALPADTEVALRVYGHTKRSIEPGAEEDSALVLPFAVRERDAFVRTLGGLRARGRTPLAYSLHQVRADLATYANDQVTVVLLTDGAEDARSKLDPTRAAAELHTLARVSFHVVGFDIDRDDWRNQLTRMAAAGGGSFWSAPRGVDLGPSLLAAVLKLPAEWRVLGGDGTQVARGRFGDRVSLPEGRYVFVTAFGGQEHTAPFWINTDATTNVLFDGGRAKVQ